MKYFHRTSVSPDEVIEAATRFFGAKLTPAAEELRGREFAGSIGRANPFNLYQTHLASVRKKVLTLPERSILLPGHGPGTTVLEERQHNPFAQDS